ncbi:unnamed protein product [Rhizophagus irregularis]|nr:unnamed protein product [Rhizophagus irregularis]
MDETKLSDDNWTSGNHVVDKFIQEVQLKAKNKTQVLEWIEYDRFGDIEYLAKGGFGTTFKTIWKDGYISDWNSNNNQWDRSGEENVALKCLHNSQDITTEFLREVESNILLSSVDGCIVRCFGITKEPKTNNFMMVMELKEEPKNANIDYSSNSFETEYSESIRIDFTKLDINSKGD